ncbi:MAG: cytochrome c-type biogenesis protein CcmH [Anaerolineales bacterium]|jgi:cytochrome c-type biogenesis protein CcmH
MFKSKTLLFLFLAVILLITAAPALAQEGDNQVTDDEVNAIAKQLFCPVCENIPLDVCPTQACEQWRGVIRDMLQQGYSEQEIKDYFVAQYGDRVLGVPPARGINWIVYIFPPVAFVAGAVILFFAIRRWKVEPTEATDSALPPELEDDPYVARIEEELRHRTG